MENFKEQDVVSAILAQVEKGSQRPQKASTKFSLTNYFGIRLPDGVNEQQIQVRILPNPDKTNPNPFQEVYGHKIQTASGRWQTFLCPKEHNDTDCPFCQARTELLSTGDAEDKKDAKKYNTKKMYVVKIIQRDKENEGVKFWRFAHSYSNQGILDKIVAIIKMKKTDVSNPQTGRDLYLDVKRDQFGNAVVSSILDGDASIITENEGLYNKWVNDERTWEDVYSVKPYDFLRLVVEGEEPYYDKDTKSYVTKDVYEAKKEKKSNDLSSSGEISMGNGAVTENGIKTKLPMTVISDSKDISDDDDDDDLPF